MRSDNSERPFLLNKRHNLRQGKNLAMKNSSILQNLCAGPRGARQSASTQGGLMLAPEGLI